MGYLAFCWSIDFTMIANFSYLKASVRSIFRLTDFIQLQCILETHLLLTVVPKPFVVAENFDFSLNHKPYGFTDSLQKSKHKNVSKNAIQSLTKQISKQ